MNHQEEFLQFRDQLRSYLYRLTTNKQDCEDILQDTYVRVTERIEQFQGKSSFKTWVFTIATNMVRDHQRTNVRWGEDWMDLVRDAHVSQPELMAKKQAVVRSSPDFQFEISEHLNYCFTCTTKTLLLAEQICLLLKSIYGFSVAEIMIITDMTEGKVKHAIADARKTMTRIFEHKCALINQNGTCSQCTGLRNIFNPEQEAQEEANKLKLVRESRNKNYEKLLDLRLEMVAQLDPLEGKGIDLHNYLLENSPEWARHQKQQTS